MKTNDKRRGFHPEISARMREVWARRKQPVKLASTIRKRLETLAADLPLGVNAYATLREEARCIEQVITDWPNELANNYRVSADAMIKHRKTGVIVAIIVDPRALDFFTEILGT